MSLKREDKTVRFSLETETRGFSFDLETREKKKEYFFKPKGKLSPGTALKH